jgi:endonuclease YncB( thermonuclease family)
MRYLLLLLVSLPCFGYELTGRVSRVVDGDTIELKSDGERYKIRLAGIDTPEKDQPWGKEAKKALSSKVKRKDITVDVVDKDRYGRLVGKIYLDDRYINKELVAEGYAWVYRQYTTDPLLLINEGAARLNDTGLWIDDDPIPPWDWRRGERSVENPGSLNPDCGSKRYCREMTSCKEARFYLRECGLSRLDGDSDGIPCVSICRR